MSTSGLRVFAGLALAIGGAILLLLAFDVYASAVRREALADGAARRAPCPEPRCECPPVAPCPPSAPAALASSSSPAPASAPASDRAFRFVRGGIILEKPELQRLAALAVELKKTTGKVTLEGHGDAPGTDERTLGLGRRRATIARQLFVDVGLDAERILVTARDVADDPTTATTVVVRPEGGR